MEINMSKNAKIKGENITDLAFQDKDINLDERCELMDLMMQVSKENNSKFFTNMVQCIRVATNMTDEMINEFSNEEIMELFRVIGDALNKKK